MAATRAAAVGASPGNGGSPASGRVPIGCTSRPGAVVSSGAGGGGRLALTFDDGPSAQHTAEILAVLDAAHVKATFFEEGHHVHGREALMDEILESGDEIGNHSYDHPRYPGFGELSQTQSRIREATGFTPCLFRPPYGLLDGRVASAASRLHLELVLWSLDSRDDKHPGAATIRSDVLSGAAPGSIVLMHDGGHHPQTVRALPGILDVLERRGFHLVTVTELLGGHFLYGP